jgi:predicted nucleic acid-binding protein
MSVLYIETTAILSWLLGEPDSSTIVDIIDDHEVIVSSVLSIVATRRALIRAAHENIISPGEKQKLKGFFANQSTGWAYLEINAVVRERAAQIFPVEPIRSLDAIHLATALEFLQIYPNLTVLSFAKRIAENLLPLGLNSA